MPVGRVVLNPEPLQVRVGWFHLCPMAGAGREGRGVEGDVAAACATSGGTAAVAAYERGCGAIIACGAAFATTGGGGVGGMGVVGASALPLPFERFAEREGGREGALVESGRFVPSELLEG